MARKVEFVCDNISVEGAVDFEKILPDPSGRERDRRRAFRAVRHGLRHRDIKDPHLMEETFKAYYYDGKSAARIEVAISVSPEFLLIRKPGGAAIEWKWKDVTQTQGFYENEPTRLEKGIEAIVLENRLFVLHLKKIAPKAASSLSGPSKAKGPQ